MLASVGGVLVELVAGRPGGERGSRTLRARPATIVIPRQAESPRAWAPENPWRVAVRRGEVGPRTFLLTCREGAEGAARRAVTHSQPEERISRLSW